MGFAAEASVKRLVADTGPLVHLHEAGGLHLLPLIGEILVSPLVLAEAKRSGGEALARAIARLVEASVVVIVHASTLPELATGWALAWRRS